MIEVSGEIGLGTTCRLHPFLAPQFPVTHGLVWNMRKHNQGELLRLGEQTPGLLCSRSSRFRGVGGLRDAAGVIVTTFSRVHYTRGGSSNGRDGDIGGEH